MSLHPDVARLVRTLEAMHSLLKQDGNEGWADEIDHCRSIISRSDFYGVERLLNLYGGMGSLNDLVIQKEGAAKIESNDAFDALRNNAWQQAKALKRDQDQMGTTRP